MEVPQKLVSLEEARLAGQKFYFTGKPCKRGHVASRYMATRACVQCHAEAAHAWKEANPEKHRTNLNTWKKKNPDKHSSYVKNARQKNPSLYNAHSKAWAQRNPEKRKRVAADYSKKNLDKILANTNARRARLLSACPSWVSKQDIQKIYVARKQISLDTGLLHHVDHVVPLRGKAVCGLHVPWNLRIIPAKENFQKGAKMDTELLEQLYGKA